MSLFNELKRRNVFRVAAAYVVIGWLILQVAEIVLGFIGAPEWVGKAIIALLLLGFVPVLALAWVFEVGPHGVRRDDGTNARDASPQARRLDVITLGSVVLVMLLLVWQHLGSALTGEQDGRQAQQESRVTQQQAAPAVQAVQSAPPPARVRPEPPPFEVPAGSIAVLPFTNRSAEPDTAYFVDGIHDDLLTQLARNDQLIVISRTSMMEYRDTTKNVRQIGEELGVATILEGAVQRAGQRVRINAQLIDAKTDAHLWADTFDRELTPENIFDLQSDIAVAIASALGRTLNVGSTAASRPSAPTLDPEAFDLYLRARAIRDEATESRIRERIELYRRALARDPKFALAMGELGREYVNLFWFHTRRDADRSEGGRWIDQALELAPDEPQLRLWRAEYFYRAHLDYEAALEELDRASEGLPGSAEAAGLRGFIERRAGRPRETIAALERAVLLDPRSGQVLQALMETGWLLGDLDTVSRWNAQLVALPEIPQTAIALHSQARMGVLGESGPLMARYVDSTGTVLVAAPVGTPTYGFDFHHAYMARDFDLAKTLIDTLAEEFWEDQFSLVPKALARAQLALVQGRDNEARREAAAAIVFLDAVLKEHPDDYRAYMAQARAKAILGEAAAARDAASRSLAMRIPSRDQLIRAELRAEQLRVLAMIDDSDTLASAMDDYLQLEMKYWHFDGLVLDPVFDAHRDHPAFQALAAKYSRKDSGA
ncbi:hypothetical protein [Wenzhouxiangella sp. XN24]|uniref:hypothetical protein n=1 Tax=Wenzhouxiangella sp. XN24 TaxID=2713569 RepID=UPI0013EC80C9|nr:hypothetical protein [Wenzhouxiangella sp. XN24]NGX15845.1 hypothetical protein [Wenzhouxiangella sp. XN24]